MSDRGATEAAMVQDTPGPQPRVSHADRVPALAWLIAGLFVILELAISARYGFQQDELYFIVAAHHLAFGYVDQPPLAPLLTRVTSLFGVSPTAIRVIPALLGGAVVVAAARHPRPRSARHRYACPDRNGWARHGRRYGAGCELAGDCT